MVDIRTPDQFELRRKQPFQRFNAVLFDFNSTAFERTLFGEGGHEKKSSWSHRTLYLFNIARGMLFFGQKVKHGTVVPHIYD